MKVKPNFNSVGFLLHNYIVSVDSYKLAAKNVNIAMAHRSFCTGLIFNSSALKVIVAHSLPACLPTLWQRLWPHPKLFETREKSSKKYGGWQRSLFITCVVVASDKIIFFNPIICQWFSSSKVIKFKLMSFLKSTCTPSLVFDKNPPPPQICGVAEVISMHNSLATSGYKQKYENKIPKKISYIFWLIY